MYDEIEHYWYELASIMQARCRLTCLQERLSYF